MVLDLGQAHASCQPNLTRPIRTLQGRRLEFGLGFGLIFAISVPLLAARSNEQTRLLLVEFLAERLSNYCIHM